jgi:aminoglycoside phosphotransferase (APT) family kinase protein
MHENELSIDIDLVRILLRTQFPHWSDLPLEQIHHTGTDNAIFRLGPDLMVRLPRIHWSVQQIEKECTWLPRLAPHLPFAIQSPLAMGRPDDTYPWHWSINRWYDGDNATLDRIKGRAQMARDLAHFLRALQSIDTTGAPGPGAHNVWRGQPLRHRDKTVHEALAASEHLIDTAPIRILWEKDSTAPEHDGPPVWIHGDLTSGNILAKDGRITAVSDFGCLAAGDPAGDLIVAWNLFDAEMRGIFRGELGLAADDPRWKRGRAWALVAAITALPYYDARNPPLAAAARQTLAAVVADTKYVESL